MLLLREWHIVAIGIILVVVGVVGQRVGDVIRLGVVSHPLILVGRLGGFVIVGVRIRRGVVLLVVRMVLIVRRVWRRIVRRGETGGRGIGMTRAVLAMRCGGRKECGVPRLMGGCRRPGGMPAG